MGNKKYIVTIVLLDDSKVIEYQDYNWTDYADKLNDPFTHFIQIGNSTINKKVIKGITISENEGYVELKKEGEKE